MKEKSKQKRKGSKKRHFESHYLAIILVVFLLLEGYLVSSTQPSDWQKGMRILDVRTSVTQTTADVLWLMEPVVDVVAGVDQFYQLSASAMMDILDMSYDGPTDQISLVAGGVYDFYQQASLQMTDLLDTSIARSWPAEVAGVSISR